LRSQSARRGSAGTESQLGVSRAVGHALHMIPIHRLQLFLALAALTSPALAQREPGHPIGKVYRIENVALRWDADFGPELTGNLATLKGFAFPFSGKQWNSFNVAIGAITFGAMRQGADRERFGGPPVGNRTGAGGSMRNGFQMDRYASLQTVGETFINMIPGIAAFIKSGLNGPHFVKELPDRAVVTWTLSEGAGG